MHEWYWLALVVGIYNQKSFILESFLYIITFDVWIGTTKCYDILA